MGRPSEETSGFFPGIHYRASGRFAAAGRTCPCLRGEADVADCEELAQRFFCSLAWARTVLDGSGRSRRAILAERAGFEPALGY